MKKEELTLLLHTGGFTLALDTNAISGGSNRFRSYTKIIQGIKNLNATAAASGAPVCICASALAHMEVLFDLRQEFGSGYDPGVVSKGLIDAGLAIQDFTEAHADKAAEYLGKSFGSADAWHTAKRETFLRCLGLNSAEHPETGARRSCPATLDWSIAAQAHAEGHVLVTDDKGAEFKQVQRKVSVETVLEALRDLVG